jgi:hypothetical protein
LPAPCRNKTRPPRRQSLQEVALVPIAQPIRPVMKPAPGRSCRYRGRHKLSAKVATAPLINLTPSLSRGHQRRVAARVIAVGQGLRRHRRHRRSRREAPPVTAGLYWEEPLRVSEIFKHACAPTRPARTIAMWRAWRCSSPDCRSDRHFKYVEKYDGRAYCSLMRSTIFFDVGCTITTSFCSIV